MNKIFKIVFCCTDNIGRSVIAEYCLKDYLAKNNLKDILVTSCGTNANNDISNFSMAHFAELKKLGIDASEHIRTQIDENIIKNNDLIILFDKFEQAWVKENFGLIPPLFNEIYKNKTTELKVSNFDGDKDNRMILTTEYINEAIPELFENIKRKYI